ncbi:unnamed protein product [Gongylonema pulchrum]|uniref:2-(3-amino-3-carboxypropyl)histidine synthase subunit 2 n=1 Tax=Gongylonema pulchrum TaxID=637853 RepID=A0A183DQW7_9BILA|nr:unnamed protein product [Gongylonema pulchrum]
MNDEELRMFVDVDGTISWIKEHEYSRVALQFPDQFLCFSSAIAVIIEKEFGGGVKTFILANTACRSCCVDVLGASQCAADCIVHYGDSCMTGTSNRLPVRYVYGNMPVECGKLRKALEQHKDKFEQKCCLLYDAMYASSGDKLFKILKEFFGTGSLFHCELIERCGATDPSTSDATNCLGRRVPKDDGNWTVLFIGEESSPLLPLWLMSNLSCTTLFTFSPVTLQCSFSRTHASVHLRKRLLLIEKLRDARTVGIVVNTLDTVGYGEAIERTRKLCAVAGKKSYTLAVGQINVPKLSNFANDVEAFVVLSCPYGVILDVSDYYRPVVSLFEAEVALNSKHLWLAGDGWTAEFKNFIHDEIGKTAEENTEMSLVTGKIRSMGIAEVDSNENSCTALSAYSAGDYFSGRTWKGLDDGYAVENTGIQEGRSGVASHYKSEPSEISQ